MCGSCSTIVIIFWKKVFSTLSTLPFKMTAPARIPAKRRDESARITAMYLFSAPGLICKEEFQGILQELMRVRKASDVPMERFNHYWREVDMDQSGQIDFEEFLVWYYDIAKTGAFNPESFYQALGQERLARLN